MLEIKKNRLYELERKELQKEKCIEMEITTEQFTCGFTPKAHKNCFFNVAPIARIPIQANRISQAPAIFLLAILHLSPLRESFRKSLALAFQRMRLNLFLFIFKSVL